MSRLFSQLENIGHDRTDVEKQAANQEAAEPGLPSASTQEGPHRMSAMPPPSATASDRPNASPASAVQPHLPGYAIASQLALPARPHSAAAPSRATWPVRLWFLSLLALIGLSLAMLLSPRDDTTATPRPASRAAGMALGPGGDDEPSPSLPLSPALPALPPAPPEAEAAVGKKPAPAATPIAKAAEKPTARQQPPRPTPEQPTTAPRAPAGDAGCSAAMAAMNLCSASHP